MTLEQLRAAMPGLEAKRAVQLVGPLSWAMEEWEVVGWKREAAFLAQIGHESGDLKYWAELWGPTDQQKKYDPPGRLAKVLGNTEVGDGLRYRGRGPMQITGKGNYLEMGKLLGLGDRLVKEPELLEGWREGARSAGAFWKSRGLNELADVATEANFRLITRRINGGFKGWGDRLARYKLAIGVLRKEREG